MKKSTDAEGENGAEDSISDDIEDDIEADIDQGIEDPTGSAPEDNLRPNYDVVLHVKPDKLPKIKTELIDGQRYIVVPIDDDEQATINGMRDLI